MMRLIPIFPRCSGKAGALAVALLAGWIAGFVPAARAAATYDPNSGTIHVQGPNNTLQSIAEDLLFPEFFSYDFVDHAAVCDANIYIECDSVLTIGAAENSIPVETLRFTGTRSSPRVLTAAGKAFFCYHSVITAAPEYKHGYGIRHVTGKVVISNSVISNANVGVTISGGAGSRHDLNVRNSRFENCGNPLVLCSVPAELDHLTFRSCGMLAVHRAPVVLTDSTFENCPTQYADVGRWRGGKGSRLVLINCTPWTNFPAGPLFFQGSCVIRQWYLRLRVIDKDGNPLVGTRVVVKDNAGRVEIEGLTDGDGFAGVAGSRNLPVTDFVHDADGLHDADPHRLDVYTNTNGACHVATVSMDNASKDKPVEKVIIIQ